MIKVLRILTWIAAGLLALYLLMTAVILPVFLWWAIPREGSKQLKHQVKVQSVWFNPFLWKLDLNGLAVRDPNDQKMLVAFKLLTVDVGFLSLFKKPYRVESIVLDGLQVHAVMSSQGKINLLELVPAAPPATASSHGSPAKTEPRPPEVTPGTPTASSAELPPVVIDTISIQADQIDFVDQTVTPHFTGELHAIKLAITNVTTDPAESAKVNFEGSLPNGAVISSQATVKPLAKPMEVDANFKLNNYVLTVVSPYSGKYTGREVGQGKLDIRMDYRILNNKLNASHKVLVQRFDFGKKVESKDALPLPFGLMIALLEDPDGKISISLPVSGDMSDPKFHYFHLIGQVARNFFMKIVTKPFAFLASVMGAESGTDDLGYVNFIPGQSELHDKEKAKLDLLLKTLAQRPRIQLTINGSYDPQLDWRAIKEEVFDKDYQQLRQESQRKETFVYQELYQRRFGIRDLWKLTKKFKTPKGYDEENLNTEIKRQLIEEGAPDQMALDALAQQRAKAVYDYFLAKGAEERRVSLAQIKPSQGSLGQVPMEFTVTIFEK